MTRTTGTVVLMAALAMPALARSEHRVDARRPAAPDARIEIENMAGSVRVTGWDREEVRVTGDLGRGADGIDLSGPPHRLQIEVDAHGVPLSVYSDLEIHVPAGAEVEIEAFEADITVEAVKGSVQANTVNGSIRVEGSSGDVELETVNGDVDFSGPAQRVHAESVNGNVTVEGASGEVEASTVNGDIRVNGGTVDRGQFETVSGRILFEGQLGRGADLDFESVSGDVELTLPAKVSADFSCSSFSGDIRNDFGPEAERMSRYTDELELRFSTGSGSARVSVETLSGTIWLRRR